MHKDKKTKWNKVELDDIIKRKVDSIFTGVLSRNRHELSLEERIFRTIWEISQNANEKKIKELSKGVVNMCEKVCNYQNHATFVVATEIMNTKKELDSWLKQAEISNTLENPNVDLRNCLKYYFKGQMNPVLFNENSIQGLLLNTAFELVNWHEIAEELFTKLEELNTKA